MSFVTAANPSFSDYRTALRNAFTGAGYTETALSGADEYGYSLASSGHNVAVKLDAATPYVKALPFSGTVNGSNPWTGQSGTVVSPTTAANQVRQRPVASSMTNYWIFSEEVVTGQEAYVHAVVEVSPGVFSHFLAGVLRKSGSYAGGAYVSSTYFDETSGSDRLSFVAPFATNNASASSQYVSLIGNTLTGNSSSISPGQDFLKGSIGFISYVWKMVSFGNGEASLVQDLYTAGINTASGLAPLLPIYARMDVNAANDYFILLGDVQSARFVNMKQFQGGDILTLGSDDWYLFPVWTKGADLPFAPTGTFSGNQTDSGYFGLAYKKVL